MSFVSNLIAKAKSQTGVHEQPKGSNRGPEVSAYQKRTGYSFPVPWCACFLYWCIDETCKDMGVENTILRTGDCDTLRHWANRNDCLFSSPQPGDLGLVMRTPSDATHIFLVESVSGGSMTTIEGNTNNDGSREGYAVVQRQRNVKPSSLFIRPSMEIAPQAAAQQMSMLGPDGTEIAKMDVVNGSSRAPIRIISKAYGFKGGAAVTDATIGWDEEDQGLQIGGKVFPEQVLVIDGVSYVPVRKLADFLGWTVNLDPAKHAVKFA